MAFIFVNLFFSYSGRLDLKAAETHVFKSAGCGLKGTSGQKRMDGWMF